MPGTRPAAVAEADVPRFIRGMFDRIVPRYDVANHVLSCGVDFCWRRRAVRELDGILRGKSAVLVDACCGTGDLAAGLYRRARQVGNAAALVLMTDFSHAMLVRGAAKAKRHRRPLLPLEADALRLPMADVSADAVTTAFGFRNLVDYDAGLREFLRVLKPGGRLVILEFSLPRAALLRRVYRWYFRHVLPRLGGWIAGDVNAYRYLQASVERFPAPAELAAGMRAAGFESVTARPLTAGIVVLYSGTRPAA